MLTFDNDMDTSLNLIRIRSFQMARGPFQPVKVQYSFIYIQCRLSLALKFETVFTHIIPTLEKVHGFRWFFFLWYSIGQTKVLGKFQI